MILAKKLETQIIQGEQCSTHKNNYFKQIKAMQCHSDVCVCVLNMIILVFSNLEMKAFLCHYHILIDLCLGSSLFCFAIDN